MLVEGKHASRMSLVNLFSLLPLGKSNFRNPLHSQILSRNKRFYGLILMVIEHSSRGERAYDIFSRLLKERRMYQ